MNLAPILVSVYNRKLHFVKCIEALSKNRLAENSILYIVSDAAFSSKDIEIVDDIRKYVFTITGFKEVIPIFRDKNLGAHQSIFQAINSILTDFGKIIFLEDDILTSVNFLEYMNSALDAYENDNRIVTITGYAPPIHLPWFYKQDVWVNRRQCAWGFATWKKKWDEINFEEYDRFSELNNNPKNVKKYIEDGEDLYYILKSDSCKEFEALDIRICYHQLLYDKLTLYPVTSKTYNMGFDGSGLRCGVSDDYHVKMDSGNKTINLPQNITQSYILKIIAKSFYDDKSLFSIVFPSIHKKYKSIKYIINKYILK